MSDPSLVNKACSGMPRYARSDWNCSRSHDLTETTGVKVADTFLISLYSPDSNSAQAAATMQSSRGEHLITSLGELEVVNALS